MIAGQIYLIYLIMILSVFQGMGIVVGIGSGFPLIPVVIFQLIFLLFFIYWLSTLDQIIIKRQSKKIIVLLILFVLYSLISAFVFPYIFEGTPVFSPRGGIDEQVNNQTLLEFSISNLGQGLYLLLNSVFLLGAFFLKQFIKVDRLLKIFKIIGLIVIFFTFYQKISSILNIWYPYEFINSNSLYAQRYFMMVLNIQRISSTFTEPSYAGSVLATYFTYFYAIIHYGNCSVINLIYLFLFLFATLLTTSSLGYGQLIFSIIIFMMLSIRNIKKISIMAIVLIILLILIWFNYDAVNELLFKKFDSSSGTNRLAADIYGIKIFLETYGLGVGLGSNRPSSFLSYLLSNLGVLGTMLFVNILVKIIHLIFYVKNNHLFAEKKAMFWSIISHVFGKVIGIPDLNFWFFWVLLFCLIIVSEHETITTRIKDG